MQSNNSIHQPTEISFQINFSTDIEPILPPNHNLKTIPKKKFFFFFEESSRQLGRKLKHSKEFNFRGGGERKMKQILRA